MQTLCMPVVDKKIGPQLDSPTMRVVVIGAGIVGLASARFLHAAGLRDLVVLDAASGPGEGTSYANGALLHPSAVEPWNSPGILSYLLRHLGREDAAVLLRARALPSLIGWGTRFLRESARSRFVANTKANTALALHSLRCMHEWGVESPLFDHARNGSLMVLRDSRALDEAVKWAAMLSKWGVRHRVLERADLVKVEPALAPVVGQLAGGIHNLDDETGDCHRCCVALSAQLAASGIEFQWDAAVDRIEADRRKVVGLRLKNGRRIDADAVVLAAGAQSPALAAAVGVRLPVRPAKGYSLTYTINSQDTAPRLPVIDRDLHVAVTPLGSANHGRLRVAGTAEFCGEDLRVAPGRVAHLAALARRLYPEVLQATDVDKPRSWTGLRPLCVDGRPLIGQTRVAGLWLNTGHGHLGWTVGAASGHLLAMQMCGKQPMDLGSLDAAAFSPARFGL